eukprot:7204141-Pyramimonas_sp.AAC.1
MTWTWKRKRRVLSQKIAMSVSATGRGICGMCASSCEAPEHRATGVSVGYCMGLLRGPHGEFIRRRPGGPRH